MSRAVGKAKRNVLTPAGAGVYTDLYWRVMVKFSAEGTTLRQVLTDLLEAYAQDNGREGRTDHPRTPPVPATEPSSTHA